LLGVVELDESIGELVPQLALPEVLELDEEVLYILARLIALLRQEASDLFVVHFWYLLLVGWWCVAGREDGL
jgi:hypothetical protein